MVDRLIGDSTENERLAAATAVLPLEAVSIIVFMIASEFHVSSTRRQGLERHLCCLLAFMFMFAMAGCAFRYNRRPLSAEENSKR